MLMGFEDLENAVMAAVIFVRGHLIYMQILDKSHLSEAFLMSTNNISLWEKSQMLGVR